MSLLSVTVKKARLVGVQTAQFNTYVTLKLQNVKSTTVTVKGPAPCWEQDFLFEINDINLGLLVEVWNKGVIWDRAIGYHYLPLASVAYDGQECGPRWVELEAQCMMRGGTVVGTTGPTGHALLLDCRFEPPFDAEGTVGADLQRKLDLLNGTLDAERAEQARRQMQYIAHSGYSEDSDYTSDLNYPVGQHPNCSASQFRSAAHQMHTPQRSLEVSRENSYERDEYHLHGDTDPLYYNSQPRTNRIDTWSQLHAQASVESAISWRTATDWQSAEDQRRPSLERQNTLYDESIGFGFDSFTHSTHIRDQSHHISQQQSYEEYYDSTCYPYQTSYVRDDSRQWDSGGRSFYEDFGMTTTEYENIINKRRTSIVQLPQVPPKQPPPSSRYSDYNEMAPYRPRPRRSTASLPATPSSTPKRGRALPMPPGSETGSLRGGRRRLPKLPYTAPVAAVPAVNPRHVPYSSEPEKATVPDLGYSYGGFGFQSDITDTVPEPYKEPSFSTTYDEDGMQPFFDETPHATPPAATQKTTWNEVESTTKFSYPVTTEDSILPKTVPSIVSSYPQSLVTVAPQDIYQHENYQLTDENLDYDKQQPYNEFDAPQTYLDLEMYHEQQIPLEETLDYQFTQELAIEKQAEIIMQQKQFDDHQLQQRQLQLERQHQQQQQRQPAQQLQASVMTGAATLGSLMAGGAKKLGSFFGAAAAAVAAPTSTTNIPNTAQITSEISSQMRTEMASQMASQMTSHMTCSMSVNEFTAVQASALTETTHMIAASLQDTYMGSHTDESYMVTTTAVATFINTATVPVTDSVPRDTPLVPSCPVTVSTTVYLHRTPSLRRQESIQKPSVGRTKTLSGAADDLPPSSYDKSAYEHEYNKTELNQSINRDMTSLDRYNEDEYVHDSIQEDVVDDAHLAEEPSPVLQKISSPTRTGSFVRKPSVDSYHSQTPSILDRKTSQSSFHHEDKLTVPVTQDESVSEKTKVTFKDDRTTYHEVPEENEFQQQDEQYREDQNYAEERENFRDENEKFEAPKFNESQDYQGEEAFPEQPSRIEQEPLQFQPEQPKLTARQRWHRAYNKIVMQLNTHLHPSTEFLISRFKFSVP